MRILLYTLTISLLAGSCASKEPENQSNEQKSQKSESVIYVDTLALIKQTFNKQIICNGKLRAVKRSEIVIPVAGVFSKIDISNGKWVQKGQQLAVIDTEDAQIELSKSMRAMEKAHIDLMDKLIGQGYDGIDTVGIPKIVMDNAKHSSGYSSAQDNLLQAQRKLKACYIKAPFSGRVANVESKVYEMSKESLCMLIDDSSFDVEFSVLEAELGEVQQGQKVLVVPFVDEQRQFEGQITEINPLVDDKGQIAVRARVNNKQGYLLEGMNVKLTINREIKDQFVVPKQAVVLRDGFNVVFRYEDGEAVWTYVDVVMSNIDSHLITGHEQKQTTISEDDIIITSGNSNLADGVSVNIK